MVGWIYSIALCVTIAAVAVGAGPYLAAMLGFEPSNNTNIVIALVLTLFATLVNLSGTKCWRGSPCSASSANWSAR
jgi:amino acid transporter